MKLVSDAQIQKSLKLMGHNNDVALTTEVSREICERVGGTVVLDGTISRLGKEYVIGLRARRCSTGEELDAEQVQFSRPELALNALDKIAKRFRTRIGETNTTIHDHETPLAEATTPSLEALKAFSQAIKTFNAAGSGAAVPLFQQAIELDPKFAEAHVWLGRMYADVGQEERSIESTQRAFDLREHASDRERFLISVSHDLIVNGDLEKARSECNAWITIYPRDVYPRAFLSGVIYPSYGQYEKALAEARASMTLDPDFVIGYRNALVSLIAMNRPTEAEQVLQQASTRKVYLPSFVADSYRIAFLKNDADARKQALNRAPKNPWLLYYEAATLARDGELTAARRLLNQALLIAHLGAKREIEAELLVGEAFTEFLYGNPEKAIAQTHASIRLSNAKSVEASAALVLAMTGKSDEAMRIVRELQRRFPSDTLLLHNQIPTIRAALFLNHKQPQQTLDQLQEASQFEPSLPLYSVFIRGEAYLVSGRASEAEAEFLKISDHPGLILNDPLMNLVQIDLARSYVIAGRKSEAKRTFGAVLQRWSKADSSFPALAQLQREYMELRE